MKKRILAVIFALVFTLSVAPAAAAVSLMVDGGVMAENVVLYQSTTYVPIRATSQALSPGAQVRWEGGQALVQTPALSIVARPGNSYLEANGRMLYAPEGIKLVNGSTLVPVRALAKAFDASVSWNNNVQRAAVTTGSGAIVSGDSFYDSDDLYWLARIIQAESGGESLAGKIAVGNVIQNRVSSTSFPDSIYGVIFDNKFGVQFQPTANGAIYADPSAESILAAKLCLDGASVAGGSLYFLNPVKASNFWIMENRAYICTIGNHLFYS